MHSRHEMVRPEPAADDRLFPSPLVTIPRMQTMLGLRTYHRARDNLAKLVDPGYLTQV